MIKLATAMKAMIPRGVRSVARRKDFFLTRVRYSRLTINQILSMGA